jgi:hypothetical protein
VPNSTWTIEVPLQVVPIPEYPRSFPSSHLDLGTCLDDCMNESRHTKARFTNCGCFKLPVRSGCFESTCAHALYSYHVHICWQMEVDVELASLLRDELGVGTMGGLGVGRKGESQEKTASDGDSALIEGLLGFGGQGALPVNWGEIVPLSMLVQNVSRSRSSRADSSSQQGGRHGQEREHKIPKALVLSMPARRYNHSVEMIDDLLRLGGELYQILHSSSKDILWYSFSSPPPTLLAPPLRWNPLSPPDPQAANVETCVYK